MSVEEAIGSTTKKEMYNELEFIEVYEDELPQIVYKNFLDEEEIDEAFSEEEIRLNKPEVDIFIQEIFSDIFKSIETRLFVKDTVYEIINKFESGHAIAEDVIQSIIDKFDSEEEFAREIVDDIVKGINSATITTHQLIESIIEKCSSTYSIVEEETDDSDTFSSAYDISLEIVEDIVENVILREISRIDKQETDRSCLDNADCIQFTDRKTLANDLIKKVIQEGTEVMEKNKNKVKGTIDIEHRIKFAESTLFCWITIQQFTITKGSTAIINYVNMWEWKENWLFDVEYLMVQSNECSDFYLYEVKFSIPTKSYPIPQATASAFFTIEVSRVEPPQCIVKVSYVLESNRLVHDCKNYNFHEDWLFNIIDAKLALFKRITF